MSSRFARPRNHHGIRLPSSPAQRHSQKPRERLRAGQGGRLLPAFGRGALGRGGHGHGPWLREQSTQEPRAATHEQMSDEYSWEIHQALMGNSSGTYGKFIKA